MRDRMKARLERLLAIADERRDLVALILLRQRLRTLS